MNRITGYLLGTAGMVACTAVMNVAGYRIASNKLENMQIEYENRVSEQVEVRVTKQMEEKAEEVVKTAMDQQGESISVSKEKDSLQVDAVYQVQNYNAVKDSTATDYETLPEELVGFTREDVEEYCKDYMDTVPVEEFLEGLQSMGVVSFAPNRLVVKKIYDSTKVQFRFYLIAVEGEVVVYYGDKKTVYEYTGIETKKLSKEERQALKKGIEIKNEEELYSVLENYSS